MMMNTTLPCVEIMKEERTKFLVLFSRVGPDIRPNTGYWNYQADYPVLSDIQPYFTKVIRSDIRQFSLLYQTKLTLSGKISGAAQPYFFPHTCGTKSVQWRGTERQTGWRRRSAAGCGSGRTARAARTPGPRSWSDSWGWWAGRWWTAGSAWCQTQSCSTDGLLKEKQEWQHS